MIDFHGLLLEKLAEATGQRKEDFLTVWFSKTLQNAKGLFIFKEGRAYYEVTHNGDKKETYVETYIKASGRTVK